MRQIPIRSLTLLAIAIAAAAAEDAAATPADPLVVAAEQGAAYTPGTATTATRTDADPQRLPVSIGVVGAKVLEDQGARSVYEGIRNVSGVVQNRGIAFNSSSDGAIIRGFRNTTMYWNGFLLEAAGAFNPQTIERLEVLKGPSSMLYGVVEPGGLVNVVSKQPSAQQSTTVSQTVGSYDRLETSVDTTGPIAADGSSAYRLVGGGLSSGSFRDHVEEQRYWAAPSVSVRLDERTTVTAEALYSQQRKTLDEGVSFDRNGNPVSSIDTFIGEPGLPGRTQTDILASGRIEHRVNDAVTLRSGILYHDWEVDINGIRRSATQATTTGTVARIYDNDLFQDASYQWTNDALITLHAGPTTHRVLVGIDTRWQEEEIEVRRASFTATSITDPSYYLALPATPLVSSTEAHRRWIGGYLQDHASLLPDDSLSVLAGVRYDRVISDSLNRLTDVYDTRDDNAWTGRVGAMWFPVRQVGVYASAAQSFVPTSTSATTVDGDLLDPEKGTQYETGVKLSAFDKALEGSVAVYDLTKRDVAMADPDHTGYSINGGEQRCRGIEVDMSADLPFGLDLIGSLTWMRSEVVESDALPEGSRLDNVPSRAGSLWAMYTVPDGALRDLGFGFGVFAQSDKNGYNSLTNTPNTFTIPGYARFDASASYSFRLPRGQLISTRLNVLNVFDTTYYESSFSSTRVFPGDPRTVNLTVSATF